MSNFDVNPQLHPTNHWTITEELFHNFQLFNVATYLDTDRLESVSDSMLGQVRLGRIDSQSRLEHAKLPVATPQVSAAHKNSTKQA